MIKLHYVALFVDLYRNETAGSCDELYSYGIHVPGQYYINTHNTKYLVTCFDRGKLRNFKKKPFYFTGCVSRKYKYDIRK